MPKILIIEDDKFLRDLMVKKIVEDEQFEVLTAVDGETGLNIFKKERPDLVLLDLILPGIDGFEVLSKMKQDLQDLSLSSVPVIILSNLGQKDDIEKGMDLGAADYMVKAHFTPNEIVSKIKQVLVKSSPKEQGKEQGKEQA